MRPLKKPKVTVFGYNIILAWCLALVVSACGDSHSSATSTTIQGSAVLSPEHEKRYRDRRGSDQQLVEALLQSEKELVQSLTSADKTNYNLFFDRQLETMFPKYQYVLGRDVLENCRERIVSTYNDLGNRIISMEIVPDSFQPAPDWRIPSNVSEINSIDLLNYGRPYSFQANVSSLAGTTGTGTFHAIVVIDRAYLIPNLDECITDSSTE